MKIFIASDLHMELRNEKDTSFIKDFPDADILNIRV